MVDSSRLFDRGVLILKNQERPKQATGDPAPPPS